ncbi:hypothetical protein [Pseudomonas borbori]|uniref:hypothetical protein n=1 Tax=Pseudomonas borbori TaxID=289003 RepID=UPI00147DC39C|nr:hypothetical protein [Pseudomonas borbori]
MAFPAPPGVYAPGTAEISQFLCEGLPDVHRVDAVEQPVQLIDRQLDRLVIGIGIGIGIGIKLGLEALGFQALVASTSSGTVRLKGGIICRTPLPMRYRITHHTAFTSAHRPRLIESIHTATILTRREGGATKQMGGSLYQHL